MATVQRMNVILDVPDDEVDYYMTSGYSVIDGNGKVIKETMPTDVATLQKCYRDHVAEIEKLKAEITKLKSESEKKSVRTSSKKQTNED